MLEEFEQKKLLEYLIEGLSKAKTKPIKSVSPRGVGKFALKKRPYIGLFWKNLEKIEVEQKSKMLPF